MAIEWWAVPHTGEIGEYFVEGEHNDFPRGVYLAYADCCLVTGLKSKQEAKKALTEYPCKKYPSKSK